LPRNSFKATSLPFSSVVLKSGALSLTFMGIIPRRTWLYRIGLRAVTFALAAPLALVVLLLDARPLPAQGITQQYGRKQVDKGPRALGLVQITDKGKARLIPITIMMDGKFYDAGSYKATPVPMALDFGIVYEGFRSGVSQGLFTITQPGQLNHNWIAEGTWLPAGAKAPEKTKKYAPPVIDEDKKDDRPVLHRRPGASDSNDKDEEKPVPSPSTPPAPAPPASAPPAGASPTGTTTPGTPPTTSTPQTSTPSTTTPQTGTAPPTTQTSTPSAPASKDTAKDPAKPAATTETARSDSSDQPFNDPHRPILRRGKPDPSLHHEPFVNFDDPVEAAKATKDASAKDASKEAAASAPSVQTVTAVSDAGGPDPRPYTYDVKPAEEAIYRNKMFDLAATQLRPKTQPAASSQPSTATKSAAPARKKPSGAQATKPEFDDVRLRIFDLSNSNEPILVLSAKTHPSASTASGSLPELQEITLIARTNLEGELQKLFFAQTDSRHLDVRPRMELIDAVDADGDGRGELLFRRTSDAGSAYAIYRVTSNGLWPLYEGTP